MAGRRSLGQFAFRVYTAMYVAVLSVGVLGDVGRVAHTNVPSSRAVALAGLVVLGIVGLAGWAGRTVVALRPTAAEIQLSLLSPAPRVTTLRRPMRATFALSAIATVALAVLTIVLWPAPFGALGLPEKIIVLLFAAGVGVLGAGVHLLVAQRRGTPLTLAGIAIGITLLADAARPSSHSVVTSALRGLVAHSPLPAVAAITGSAGSLGWLARRHAERLSLEAVARGAATSDGASLAIAGNDVRSLLLTLRAASRSPWRAHPRFAVPTAFALRFPAIARSLRALARWRVGRALGVLGLVGVATALLVSGAPSTERGALAALVLWALGLSLNEPLAQEHDRRDRLSLLPAPPKVELRLLAVSVSTTFVVMSIALATQLPARTALWLGCAATGAATVSAGMSLRATWKLLLDPSALGLPPEVIGGQMLYKLARPALVGFVCLSTWRGGLTGPVVAGPGVAIGALFVASIVTDGFARLRERMWIAVR